MQLKESLEEFYSNYRLTANESALTEAESIKIYRRSDFMCKDYLPLNRRDFYKITLIKGEGILEYANKGIEIKSNALLFTNPITPYSWEASSLDQEGYFCVFKEEFIARERGITGLSDSPLFQIGNNPVFFLSTKQQIYLSSIFEKMIEESESNYALKYDVLRNHIHLILHEASKMQPINKYFSHGSNAAERITHYFLEALELQFPIDSMEHRLTKNSPSDFAEILSVHVNHLNRSVKQITGKTTSELISRRIVQEAETLLKHTKLNVSEIAYCLGFNESNYFNNFFKKIRGVTPGSVRK